MKLGPVFQDEIARRAVERGNIEAEKTFAIEAEQDSLVAGQNLKVAQQAIAIVEQRHRIGARPFNGGQLQIAVRFLPDQQPRRVGDLRDHQVVAGGDFSRCAGRQIEHGHLARMILVGGQHGQHRLFAGRLNVQGAGRDQRPAAGRGIKLPLAVFIGADEVERVRRAGEAVAVEGAEGVAFEQRLAGGVQQNGRLAVVGAIQVGYVGGVGRCIGVVGGHVVEKRGLVGSVRIGHGQCQFVLAVVVSR